MPRPESGGLELGQALADVANLALIANRTSREHAQLTRQLQTALNSRVEQAKG